MRKQLYAVGLMMAALTAAPAFADTKIAVLDVQAALSSTDAAKKMFETLATQLKPQRDRMEALRREAEALNAKAQKDSAVMSEADKKNLQKQIEQKVSEYQSLGQVSQKTFQDTQNDLLQRLGPKLEQIVEDLRKQGGYELILDRKAAVGEVDPAIDLTKKVTERLNAAK